MTALSDLLTDAKNQGRNVDHWIEQAAGEGHEIDRATVYRALAGDHAKRPRDTTLQALAFVFGLDVRELRQAVKVPAGELGPWQPVAESAQLSQPIRAALDGLIKAIVREGGAEDEQRPATTKTPDSGPAATVTDLSSRGRSAARKRRPKKSE